MLDIIILISCIYITDIIGIKLSKILSNQIQISDSTRWFFLHFITNFFVTYYSFFDLCLCLYLKDKCYELTWNDNSYKVFKLAMTLHMYHIIFMPINFNDFIHHFIMCIVGGSFCFYQKSILTSCALFFLNGLPGFIDYFLLWLTKINKLDNKIEKMAYIYISVWLRSPGTIIISYYGLIGCYYYYLESNYHDFIILFIPIILLFWNGQYYMMITCRDNYRKILK